VSGLRNRSRIGTIIAFELIGHFSDARQASVTHSFDRSLLRPADSHSFGMILVYCWWKYARHRAGFGATHMK